MRILIVGNDPKEIGGSVDSPFESAEIYNSHPACPSIWGLSIGM
jgi:hypothetical protein